mmetsp:Transcript_17059/g.22106  ORF Transcript_17059/g.22106 Transcript_17059/m.22106 type:complete len:435 (-) Transcript_17059:151-1455(-)
MIEDIEGYAGLKRTKGGSNDTEPAYQIKRKMCWRYVLCVLLILIIGFLWLWQSETALKKISPRLAKKRSELRYREHRSHSKFARLGQEFEAHLESDARERESAMQLRAKLRVLEKMHRANITRALDAAAIGAEDFSPAARDAAMPYVEEVLDLFFNELREVVDARILNPLLNAGVKADERHKELHEQILSELRKDREERAAFIKKTAQKPNFAQGGDLDGDGFVEDTDLDGYQDIDWHDYDDQALEKRDEEWRQDILNNFKLSFERHFNDTAMLEDGFEPHALLTPSDPLYQKLKNLEDQLAFDPRYIPDTNHTKPTISWKEAETQIIALEPQLKQFRCHSFLPSDPPVDDEFDYMQVHHVQHYLNEMLWHAHLNAKRKHIEQILQDFFDPEKSKITSLEAIEQLELLEGENIFPSYWLFHAGHYDDFYRYEDW